MSMCWRRPFRMFETCFQSGRFRLVLSFSTLLVILTSYQFLINVSVFNSAYTDQPVFSIWRKLRSLSIKDSVDISKLFPNQQTYLHSSQHNWTLHADKKVENKTEINLPSLLHGPHQAQNSDVKILTTSTTKTVTLTTTSATSKPTSNDIVRTKSLSDQKSVTEPSQDLSKSLVQVPEISLNSSFSSNSDKLNGQSNSSLKDTMDNAANKSDKKTASAESKTSVDELKLPDKSKAEPLLNLSDLILQTNRSQTHSKSVLPSFVSVSTKFPAVTKTTLSNIQTNNKSTTNSTPVIVNTEVPSATNLTSSKKTCNEIPSALKGRTKVSTKAVKMKDAIKANPKVQIGGSYKPPSCQPKNKVAIIIPFRNRTEQLQIFLNHIHPFLQRQEIQYRIYVVNQAGDAPFNRATLLNIGFTESQKDDDFNCNIFHDVDLLPEDDRNLYICEAKPKHMSVAVNTMKYQLPYKTIFGGVTAISTQHFKTLNGYSNEYWGWGAEDDDMYRRIKFYKMNITRPKKEIARYTMIKHKKELANKDRNKLLKLGKRRFKTDGLVNLKYQLISKENERLYTNVTVLLEKPKKDRGKRATQVADKAGMYTLRGSFTPPPPSQLKVFLDIRQKILNERRQNG